MDKQDLMYGALALVIIVIVAIVIKPMVTGQPVNIGIPTPTPTPTPAITQPVTTIPVPVTATTVPTTAPTPSPSPTWDLKTTNVQFVDPSQYGISMNQSLPGGSRIDYKPLNTTMITYSTIPGQFSGTTNIFYMPFPYWEIWYTVEPASLPAGKDQRLSTSTVTGPKSSGIKGSGSSQTVIQGSFSVTNPDFTIQVMDGEDPNRIVRSINPPGGLDKSLWVKKTSDGDLISSDPRPWIEKFYEGERKYFLVINAHSLESYNIEIRVPAKYAGQF